MIEVPTCPKQLEVFFFNWKDDKKGDVVRVDVSSGLTRMAVDGELATAPKWTKGLGSGSERRSAQKL